MEVRGVIHFETSPSPPIDSTRAMMIIWRLGGKIIGAVLGCILYNSCAQ